MRRAPLGLRVNCVAMCVVLAGVSVVLGRAMVGAELAIHVYGGVFAMVFLLGLCVLLVRGCFFGGELAAAGAGLICLSMSAILAVFLVVLLLLVAHSGGEAGGLYLLLVGGFCSGYLAISGRGLMNWSWRLEEPVKGMCPRCGYDLRATPTRCPECGWEVGRRE